MPAKNTIKVYAENVFYHAYNRGYSKQEIFRDEQDYFTFLHLFKKYLEPGFQEIRYTRTGESQPFTPNYAYEDVDLIAYCLMPNHFHLLVYQKTHYGMPKLLTRLCSNYSTYFNEKYQQQGSPFQGTYKAVLVKTEEQFLHLSRYIHINPHVFQNAKITEYPYSSYQFYTNSKSPLWLQTEPILTYFPKEGSYRSFVEDFLDWNQEEKDRELEKIKGLQLYRSFIDPSSNKKFPFMFFGPVSPLSFTGSPLFLEVYTDPAKFK